MSVNRTHHYYKNLKSKTSIAAGGVDRRLFLLSSTAGLITFSARTQANQNTEEQAPLLKEFDALPSGKKLPWIMEKLTQGSLQFFQELRDNRPILDTGEVVLISRYADVVESLSHPTVFSVRLYKPKMGDFLMTHDETPTHRRDKSVMAAMLPRSDEQRIRELICEFCKNAILASNGRIEIVDSLTRAAAVHLVKEYCGLDGVSSAKLREWSFWSQYDNFHNHTFHSRQNSKEISDRANQAKQELARYATELVKRRVVELKDNPERDDIVSRMLKAQLPEALGFGSERIVVNTIGLLIGAVETTSHSTVNIVDYLLDHPNHLKSAAGSAQKDDFAKFSKYVWEASRFQPLSSYLFRYCESDFSIAKGTKRETKIKEGRIVLPITQAAMFDPIEFEKPSEFLYERPSYQSFLFGFGNHKCLGEFIGAQMIPAIVREILLVQNLRRANGPQGNVDFKGGPFPESLTLEFDPK